MAILIQASTPDYLFSEFIVLGFLIYGSHWVTEDVDSSNNFEDDLDLDFIYIPVDDWVQRVKLEWTRVRPFVESNHEDLACHVGKYVFNWVHDAFVTWIYRNIHLFPGDKQVQAFAGARPQIVIRPGHSIYRPPHLQTTFTERVQADEQALEKIELEVAQEEAIEPEQEEHARMKRRTRRGGRKFHDRKQRRLERMTACGDSEYGDDETVISVSSEPR